MLKEKIERVLQRVQKPARYTGGEFGSIVKDKAEVDVRFAFCFPDTYEIGMSHLGMKILYHLTNEMEGVWCERVFAPAPDMQAEMEREEIPLFALESRDPIGEFDFIGFTLQYELCYTNLLNMLRLGGIPLKAADRKGLAPIVVAGGPCTCNPEPLADFIDIFIIGEGEEVNPELIRLYADAKKKGLSRAEFLRAAARIEGLYVPSLYDVTYGEDGTISSFLPRDGAPARIKKRIIKDFDKVYYPEQFIVPYIETVHDRAMLEVMRGCIRGCRFCQAGFLYRPLREKTAGTLAASAHAICEATGYDEISLTSLSTGDYSGLDPLVRQILPWTKEEKINLSLPSLRIDNFPQELLDQITSVRKSGLTFAPEAGTQRMRDVINKNITEEEILSTCRMAFDGGYSSVKLYFMMGLPFEMDEDIIGINTLAKKVVEEFFREKRKGKGLSVSCSVSSFVPKPFTPFQFDPSATREELARKQQLLLDTVASRKVHLSWHDPNTSMLEAVFARGDRRLGAVLEAAFRKGCRFDAWDEHFRIDLWEDAFAECGVSTAFYAHRARSYDEILPWDHIDIGVSKEFFIREHQRAAEGKTTPNCRQSCAGCGANKLKGGPCF
ncbi:MAG: TIGR03960 family B12-binding radical SAM protein [Oscillospiraceae bacterium]|nr:TIGR03960 family B12-binding radical SAM protein [Oscillospiraceae bacterium]